MGVVTKVQTECAIQIITTNLAITIMETVVLARQTVTFAKGIGATAMKPTKITVLKLVILRGLI